MSNTIIGKIIIGLAVLFCILFLFSVDNPEGATYDCGMAEWHPDIPKAVKEECRRIRYEHWKKEQELKQQTVI